MSPALENAIERLRFVTTMALFDPDKRLKEREDEYVLVDLAAPGGCVIVRETEEGWWFESHDLRKNMRQLERLLADPTVACGWYTTPRFNDPGGWYDP